MSENQKPKIVARHKKVAFYRIIGSSGNETMEENNDENLENKWS